MSLTQPTRNLASTALGTQTREQRRAIIGAIEHKVGGDEAKGVDAETLRKENETLKQENRRLHNELDYWRKMFFGSKSEKKPLPENPDQLKLFSDEELAQMTPEQKEAIEREAEKQEEVITRTITVKKKKPARAKLDTEGLPVKENHVYPEGTTDGQGNLLEGYQEIGVEVSERLQVVPAHIYVERTIRHKIISGHDMELNPEERRIMIAPLEPSAIEKGMAGETLLTDIIINRFRDHLPYHRQIRRYLELGVRIPASTMGDWFESAVEALHPLYKLLREKVMASEYIQIDESTVPVIDNEKKRTRKGYLWCVRDGIEGQLFFWYDRGSRSKATARQLLGAYRGTFQSDGYEAYDQFCRIPGVLGAACWAHVRRYFVDALKEDKKHATQAIVMIGKLYEVEKEADEQGLGAEERCKLRKEKAYPVIQLFEKWCVDTYAEVLEKSLMGKAIAYAYSLIDRLCVYVTCGRINIDNNLIENAIRPLALGRRNWLFCGNDASAYRAAIVYSLMGSCRAADVDPREWMEHALNEIPRRKKSGETMDDLLPDEYAKRPGIKHWNLTDPE